MPTRAPGDCEPSDPEADHHLAAGGSCRWRWVRELLNARWENVDLEWRPGLIPTGKTGNDTLLAAVEAGAAK